METLKQQEAKLLNDLCDQYNLTKDLINLLVRTAEKNMHENRSLAEKRTDYIDMISYHSKRKE
ncbi:DnaD domain protein [Paenibacillus cellulositrophicus]